MNQKQRSKQLDVRFQVVGFALNEWRAAWMNRQQILSRLSAFVPVCYSNGPWFVWDRTDPKWKAAPIGGRFVEHEGVWVDTPPRVFSRWPKLRSWDYFALRAYGSHIRQFVRTLGDGPTIGYVFHPSLIEAARAVKANYLVYHAYDLFDSGPHWTVEIGEQQEELVKSSSVVIASSDTIASALSKYQPKRLVVIPNGANSAAYATAANSNSKEPEDLANIPRPRVGYTGNLNRKVDFPLIERLAREYPAWQFVIIGGILANDEAVRDLVSRLEEMGNIHFLGYKDHRRLPDYVAKMDVNIMCYRAENAGWVVGSYPLKLHEYLSAGRPVVSTDFPAVREFSDVVAIAKNDEDWGRELELAILGRGRGTRAERQQVGRCNSWDARVDRITAELKALTAEDKASG